MKKLWLLPVFTLALWGADINGKWTGNIEVADPSSGDKINTPVKAQFDQNSAGISGKIGRTEDEEQEPIRNAKLDGKNLVFEVTAPETTGASSTRPMSSGMTRTALPIGGIAVELL